MIQLYGHRWNQVKIDGKWYNADLTWDYRDIQAGAKSGEDRMLAYCLKGDEEFYKEHTASELVQICSESYDPNVILETLRRMNITELEQNSFDATKEDIILPHADVPRISVDSLRRIAKNTRINPRVIDDLRQIVEQRIDRDQSNREEIS